LGSLLPLAGKGLTLLPQPNFNCVAAHYSITVSVALAVDPVLPVERPNSVPCTFYWSKEMLTPMGNQMLLGTVFTGMGLATMLFPVQITELSFTKEFLGSDGVTAPLKLAIQCFGSQATLCGVLILSCKFTSETFRNLGIAIIPDFLFDYNFWRVGALTSFGAAGDAAGNVIFSYCCLMGYLTTSKGETGDDRREE
jgi:hypothetical protein